MAKAKVKAKGKKPAAKKADDRPKGVLMDFRIDDITYAPETQPRDGDGSGQKGIYQSHVEDIRRAIRAKVKASSIWSTASGSTRAESL